MSTELVFEWGEPPPSHKGTFKGTRDRKSAYEWLKHLRPLMERPSEWAEVARCYGVGPLSAQAASIKDGSSRQSQLFHMLGHWEATTRHRPGDEHASLYVRWLGPREIS